MEFLKKVLGDEAFDVFEASIKKHNDAEKDDAKKLKIVDLSSGEYVLKAKYDGEIAQAATDKKAVDDQLVAVQADLKKIGESKGDLETVKKELADAATANETAVAELKSKAATNAKAYEIRLAVINAGAKDEKSVIAHLDASTIKLEDGKLSGLEGQLTEVQKSHDYLFGEPKTVVKIEPANPPKDPKDLTADQWQGKLKAAREIDKTSGSNVESIKVKQAAAVEGTILN